LLGNSLRSYRLIILGKHVRDRLIVVLNQFSVVVEAFLICNVVLAFLGVVLCSGHDGGLVTVLSDIVVFLLVLIVLLDLVVVVCSRDGSRVAICLSN